MGIDLSSYKDARELFGAVRNASVEADRTLRTLRRIEAAEGVRAQSYEARGRSGHRSDATARTDARIDFEDRMRERIEEDYAVIDLGTQVIYGREPGKGGVNALLDSKHADAMWWRFCAAESWRVVADRVGLSESWCKLACEAAMDQVDAYGLAAMLSGLGSAAE